MTTQVPLPEIVRDLHLVKYWMGCVVDFPACTRGFRSAAFLRNTVDNNTYQRAVAGPWFMIEFILWWWWWSLIAKSCFESFSSRIQRVWVSSSLQVIIVRSIYAMHMRSTPFDCLKQIVTIPWVYFQLHCWSTTFVVDHEHGKAHDHLLYRHFYRRVASRRCRLVHPNAAKALYASQRSCVSRWKY